MARVPLSTEQHRRLTRLIAANAYMLAPGGRQTILDEAGLADFRTRLDFASDARTFASQLVRVLQDHGTLDETGQPALVSLLRWLRAEVAGHEDDRAFVDGLLAPYGGARGAEARGGVEGAKDLVMAPVEPTPEIGRVRQRWALLVGVNEYTDEAIPNLRYCVNDVLALEARLSDLGYAVVALHDEARASLLPTRDNVEGALARLCRGIHPDDLLLVHFSGHGELVEGKPLLITREVHHIMAAKRALPVAEVEETLRASGVRRRVLFLDACHSGEALARDLLDPAFVEHVYERAQGYAVLAATSADSLALESGDEKHGIFTHFLLEGLSGKADSGKKGFVSFHDLETYVLDALRRWSIQKGGPVQVPTARKGGRGDMILADFRPADPAPTQTREQP